MADVEMARAAAEALLARTSPGRWRHVRAVAAQAADVSSCLGHVDEALVASASLHDVGYAPELVVTGFHPLDRARHLRMAGFEDRVVSMVAHHSYARIEAGLRGLGAVLDREFQAEDSLATEVLCYCDMTTTPEGGRVDVEQRLAEIRVRYGPGDVVTQFVDCAESGIVATVRRVEGLLSAVQPR